MTKRIIEIICVAAIVLLGGYLRFYNLDPNSLTEVQPDEGRIALGAATIVHYRTPILNYESSHEPPMSLYYPIPFMAVFGDSFRSIKFAPIFFTLCAIAVTYLLGRSYFSWRVGLVSALSFAVLPFSVRHSRILVEHSFLPLFTALVFYCFAQHVKTGKARWLYGAAAAMGLGLSTKIIYLYFIIAFFIALLISGEARRMKITRRQAAATTAAFICGALPFFLFAVLCRGLSSLLREAAAGGGVGHTAGYFFDAFIQRLTTAGDIFTPAVWLAVLSWLTVMVWRWKLDTRIVFLSLFFVSVLVMSIVTVSGMHEDHLMVLLPVPLVLASSLIDFPGDRYRLIKNIFTVAAVLMILLTFHQSHFPRGYTSFCYENKNAYEMLKSLDFDTTVATQKDISMFRAFMKFQETNKPPSPDTGSIVTFSCNRFTDCPKGGVTLYPNIEESFRSGIRKREGANIPPFMSGSDALYSEAHISILKEVIADFIFNRGKRNIIIMIKPEKADCFFALNRHVEAAMAEMMKNGEICYRRKEYLENEYGFVVNEIIRREDCVRKTGR